MNTKEIDEKIFIVEQKIINENDDMVFSITKIKNLTYRETSFIHIDKNYKITLQFIIKKNFVRIFLLKSNRRMGYKTTKITEINLGQENEIYKTIHSYKKEIAIRNIF